MLIEKNQIWTKKGKEYLVVRIDVREIFTYIWVLPDGEEDVLRNHLCYGKKIFQEDFKFIKEVSDG